MRNLHNSSSSPASSASSLIKNCFICYSLSLSLFLSGSHSLWIIVEQHIYDFVFFYHRMWTDGRNRDAHRFKQHTTWCKSGGWRRTCVTYYFISYSYETNVLYMVASWVLFFRLLLLLLLCMCLTEWVDYGIIYLWYLFVWMTKFVLFWMHRRLLLLLIFIVSHRE